MLKEGVEDLAMQFLLLSGINIQVQMLRVTGELVSKNVKMINNVDYMNLSRTVSLLMENSVTSILVPPTQQTQVRELYVQLEKVDKSKTFAQL